MSETVEITSSNDQSPSSSICSWLGALLLSVIFGLSLWIYPPLQDASAMIETPVWVKFLGRFHIIALHLPVGVLVLAAIVELAVLLKLRSSRLLAPATNFILMIGALGSVVAVVLGIILARKGGFGFAEFYAHQAFGIATAIAALLTLMLKLTADSRPVFTWPYRFLFALTLLLMTVGAHFGGNMVHESDYLTKYAPKTVREGVERIERTILGYFEPARNGDGSSHDQHSPKAGTQAAYTQMSRTATVYAALVAPILADRCISCHGEEKSKGDLRLDTHEFILLGGSNGEVVVAGLPEKSKLIQFVTLPSDDDDHMPPNNKPQPTAQEIALLAWWIKEGASKDIKLAKAKVPDELKSFVKSQILRTSSGTAGTQGGAPAMMLALAGIAGQVEPAIPGATQPAAVVNANPLVYKDIVAPIFEAKCVKCHGKEKSKGKLRMHTLADLMKGGSDGATTVVAGKPVESLMIKRALLPLDDDDHMPPKEEKQTTKEEIAILKWWIDQGASETLALAAAKKTPEIEAALKVLSASAGKDVAPVKSAVLKLKSKPLTADEKKAVAGATAKMMALNTSLMPVAFDSEQLRFGCINAADEIGDKELAELAPVASHIVWAELGRSKVTDAGLATIAMMPNLERLHLENTAVTDAGLVHLAGLARLEYLNLYGTKVTDAGIARLAGMKSLKKLFLWQTAATKDGAKSLEAAIPGLVVNVGLSEAEIAKLLEENKPSQAVNPAKPVEKKVNTKEKANAAPAKTAEPAAKPAVPNNPPAQPVKPADKK